MSKENLLGIDTAARDAEKLPIPATTTGGFARGAGTLSASTANNSLIANHTHALTLAPALLGPGSAQYQYIVSGAGAGFAPAYSTGFLNITAAQTLAVTTGGTLALGGFTGTLPEALTFAGRNVANTFTAAQTINVNSSTALLVEQTGVKNNVFSINTTTATVGVIGQIYIGAVSTLGSPIKISGTYTLGNAGGALEFVPDLVCSFINSAGIFARPASVNLNTGSFYGVYSGISALTCSNTTRVYGFYYADMVSKTGTLTEQYGLYINGIIRGVSSYAIYTNAGLNRLGDQLSIVGSADRQQFLTTGFTTQAVATPIGQFTRNDTAAGVSAVLGLTGLGSGANGDGISVLWSGKTSTTAAQPMALIEALWVDATHASRKAKLRLSAYDTAVRNGLEISADGVAGITRTLAARELAYATTAANLTLTSAHHWVKVTAACTITLPPCTGLAGRDYLITATADNVIVDGNAAETIDGELTQVLSTYDSIRILSDGANWFIS